MYFLLLKFLLYILYYFFSQSTIKFLLLLLLLTVLFLFASRKRKWRWRRRRRRWWRRGSVHPPFQVLLHANNEFFHLIMFLNDVYPIVHFSNISKIYLISAQEITVYNTKPARFCVVASFAKFNSQIYKSFFIINPTLCDNVG